MTLASATVGDEALFRRIGGAYPSRRRRYDLEAVDELRRRAGIAIPENAVAVVGTNGKTSTSIYLARLLTAAGLRAGVTTSPHVERWGERVSIAGTPVDDGRLLAEVVRLHELARGIDSDSLRFFDLVTLAAAKIFADEGVDVPVFEAGIGGRHDATQTLRARLVVLTSIGLDHVALLGSDERGILAEKLGVAPVGARVVAAPLSEGLRAEAERIARSLGLELDVVDLPDGPYLERNFALAEAAMRHVTASPAGAVDHSVVGRMQVVDAAGVRAILDAAHNPQAWEILRGELPPAFVAVVSISSDRDPRALVPALAGAVETIPTTAWPGRSLDAVELARALGSDGCRTAAIENPVEAVLAGRDRAAAACVPLVVFGSTYLLPHALEAVRLAGVTRPSAS